MGEADDIAPFEQPDAGKPEFGKPEFAPPEFGHPAAAWFRCSRGPLDAAGKSGRHHGRPRLQSALVGWFFLLGLAACGAKTGLKVPEFELDAAMDARPDVAAPDTPVDVPEDRCVPFRAEARLASLDMFILMDSSGSMMDATTSGISKAEAINDALAAFLQSRESEGLSAALNFFPLIDSSVPEYCSTDAMCGDGGTCLAPDICLPEGDILCSEDSHCPGETSRCEPLGRCAGSDEFCLEPGSICPGGARCINYGLCENRTICRDQDYSNPVVGLGRLPGNASPIVDALRARESVGGTPTWPALTGALTRARQWAELNPANKVLVLLATDGFPANCDDSISFFGPTDPAAGIERVVDVAANGVRDGIETFVIGVFASDEESDARENLSRIAMAGGTDQALVVTTREPVTEAILEILTELRREVRTCAYSIPAAGVLPDPESLEVQLLGSGVPIPLRRVRGADACFDELGYFFPVDTDDGARPGFIELCPAACVIATAPDVVVEMQAGCS